MIYITIMGHGVRNSKVTRVVKCDSLDCTSVPSAELINGRLINLYECPEGINPKLWKRLNKQARLELVWRSMSRNKRLNVVVTLLAESFGDVKVKWYEI